MKYYLYTVAKRAIGTKKMAHVTRSVRTATQPTVQKGSN